MTEPLPPFPVRGSRLQDATGMKYVQEVAEYTAHMAERTYRVLEEIRDLLRARSL